MRDHGLENRTFVKLPEGVDIAITSAGIVSRSYAYLIDFAIRAVVVGIISFVLLFLGDIGEGISLVMYFLVSWGYNIFFEARNGQTPGKKRLNIRVVQDNGLPPNFSQVVLRNLIRPADMLPIGYFLGLLTMCSNERFKRIGDWAAGTIVIYDEEMTKSQLLPDGPIEIPKIAFTTQEQLAVIDFAERSTEISAARNKEMATILSASLNLDESTSVSTLLNYARYFAGRSTIGIANPTEENK